MPRFWATIMRFGIRRRGARRDSVKMWRDRSQSRKEKVERWKGGNVGRLSRLTACEVTLCTTLELKLMVDGKHWTVNIERKEFG